MKVYFCDRCGKEVPFSKLKMPFLRCFELCPECNKKLDELIEAFFNGGKRK